MRFAGWYQKVSTLVPVPDYGESIEDGNLVIIAVPAGQSNLGESDKEADGEWDAPGEVVPAFGRC